MAIDNCDNLHPSFGCERMHYAQELMCYDHVENVCKKQCCFGCTDACGYRCYYTGKASNYDQLDEDTLMAIMMMEANDNGIY